MFNNKNQRGQRLVVTGLTCGMGIESTQPGNRPSSDTQHWAMTGLEIEATAVLATDHRDSACPSLSLKQVAIILE